MTADVILIFILANILGGLTWQLKREKKKEGEYLLITSIISVVFLLSNVFIVGLVSDSTEDKYKEIIFAVSSPIIFTVLMLLFAFLAGRKLLIGEKSFKEWLRNNFISLLMRIAIVSIYAFLTLLLLFLFYFSIFGYDSTNYKASDVSNTLTLLGIVTTLFGILISLYEKLK